MPAIEDRLECPFCECLCDEAGICPNGHGWYTDDSEYEEDEWYDSWETDEDWDYQPDPLHEWRYPEFRPSFLAIFRWWGVQYLPVWIYGVARGFWFDSVVPHFRRSDDNIGDIPF